MEVSPYWRCGFEVEVVLGTLGDARFEQHLASFGSMDQASPAYCQAVAKLLSHHTGCEWKAPTKPKSKLGYYVVPEYDLDPIMFPTDALAGVELITPPLPLAEAEQLRDSINGFIDRFGSCLNFDESCWNAGLGWHINVDAGAHRNLDIEDFAALSDELPTLLGNNRAMNGYTSIQRHAFGVPLLRHLLAGRTETLVVPNLENFLIHHAGRGKRYAANFEKLERGYLELRHFGIRDFIGLESLPDLLCPLLSAFEADHNTVSLGQRRLESVFGVLRNWFGTVQSDLSTSWDDKTTIGRSMSGEIYYRGATVARTFWNGTMDVAILNNKNNDAAIIRDQEMPDMLIALSILALDLAEMVGRQISKPKLLNPEFMKQIETLAQWLSKESLLAPIYNLQAD